MRKEKAISYLCLIFCMAWNALYGFTLSEKLLSSSVKSFVVYHNQNIYNCLIYHSNTDSSFFLEEISIPNHLAKDIKDWKTWIQNGAALSSSHLLYEIDTSTSEILTCYSFTKQSFEYLSHEGTFINNFLKLPLSLTPNEKRKKIGGVTSSDLDVRKEWNPPLIFEGNKKSKQPFDVYEAKWPSDNSELAGQSIQCYFSHTFSNFAFPHWIEVGNEHNHLNLKAIDSGYLDFISVQMPKMPPEIYNLFLDNAGLHIHLKLSSGLKTLHFMLVDVASADKQSFLLQHPQIQHLPSREQLVFFPKSYLLSLVKKGQPYQLLIIPEDTPSLTIEYPHDLILAPS